MRSRLKFALVAAGLVLATQAAAQVAFYEAEGYRGGVYRADRAIANFAPAGFNDRASSAIVERGRWEVCEHAGFRGRCVVLRRGSYPSLAAIGLNNTRLVGAPGRERALRERGAAADRAGLRISASPQRAAVRGPT